MRYLPLILILGSIVVFAIRPAGLYDSVNRKEAYKRYANAPSETTLQAYEDVKTAERKEINFCMALSAVLAVTGVWIAVRQRMRFSN